MRLSWQHVTVIGMVLATVSIVVVVHGDVLTIIGLAVLVLTSIGAAQLPAIREQANGRQSELLTMVKDLAQRLAEMQPPTKDPP